MNKKILKIFALALSLVSFSSCSKDSETAPTDVRITFNFNQNWDGKTITNTDFNDLKFTNAFGTTLSISKLRYLISNIKFIKPDGDVIVLAGYNLVDVTNNKNLSFTPSGSIPLGEYSQVLFTFGFDNDSNYNNNYTDLNAASWNVPEMLGGGYHFMQLEGKFIDASATETNYAIHMIKAVDNSGATLTFQDTFFEVNLGSVSISKDTDFTINMNIAAWFGLPNIWDLNEYNNMLMSNFSAQIMLFENGQNIFSLKPTRP